MQRTTITVSEAANYLGVSTTTIYAMVRKQELPYVRVRSRILFRVESLDAWMREQELPTNQLEEASTQ